MKPLIICINGPRHSGKDTLALALQLHWSRQGGWVNDLKFADPIERAIAAMLPTSMSKKFTLARHDPHQKLQHSTIYPGSPAAVDLLNGFGDNFAKRTMGLDIFGVLAAETIRGFRQREQQLITISDCGYQAEYDALVGALPDMDVVLVRLYRDGYEFGEMCSDPRGYVVENGSECAAYNIKNQEGLSEMEDKAGKLLSHIQKHLSRNVSPA